MITVAKKIGFKRVLNGWSLRIEWSPAGERWLVYASSGPPDDAAFIGHNRTLDEAVARATAYEANNPY